MKNDIRVTMSYLTPPISKDFHSVTKAWAAVPDFFFGNWSGGGPKIIQGAAPLVNIQACKCMGRLI